MRDFEQTAQGNELYIKQAPTQVGLNTPPPPPFQNSPSFRAILE